jgi:hypothetical protein
MSGNFRNDHITIACSPISKSRIRLFEKGEAHVEQDKKEERMKTPTFLAISESLNGLKVV